MTLNTETLILKKFLQNREDFINGQDLADELGISRVGIWNQLEKLRGLGMEFEAVRNRGYRLISEPQTLCEPILRAWLSILEMNIALHYLQTVESTNSEANRLLGKNYPTPLVVISEEQTKGRGRRGRVWHSPAEGNLYASFAFQPQLPPMRMQSITLYIGLRLCDWLHTDYNIPIKIKWPNDLLINGRKVSGILTEARIDADNIRDLVFGIGINVHGRSHQWPEEVQQVATTVSENTAKKISLNEFAASVSKVVLSAYNDYVQSDTPSERFTKWSKYDILFNQIISYQKNNQSFTGTGRGIDSHGNLIVEALNGETTTLSAGEVSIGSRPMAAT